MKEKKDLTLEKETVNFALQYKSEHGLRSISSAIDEIVSKYREQQNGFVDEVGKKTLEEIKKEYDEKINKISFAAKSAGFNSQVIIELLNTMIISMQIESTYLTSDIASNVLDSAQKAITERIAYYKQLKENNKNRRKGTER